MMMDIGKFFEEKQLGYKIWEIEHKGIKHHISSDVVIQAILESKGEERCKIAGILFSLDFRNHSILDYLEYLAKLLIIRNC